MRAPSSYRRTPRYLDAAGGVSPKAALHRLVLVKETLDDEWLTPELTRGASSLLNDLLTQYRKVETGRYDAQRTSRRNEQRNALTLVWE